MLELLADHEMDPWGEERADLRNGVLCSLVANALRGKDDPPARPLDFVPDFGGGRDAEPQALSAEESRDLMRTLAGRGEGGGEAGDKANHRTLA